MALYKVFLFNRRNLAASSTVMIAVTAGGSAGLGGIVPIGIATWSAKTPTVYVVSSSLRTTGILTRAVRNSPLIDLGILTNSSRSMPYDANQYGRSPSDASEKQ